MARTANRFHALEDKTKTVAAAAAGRTYRVALYARLSADRDGRRGESIENQLDIMKNYIKSHPELSNYREYVDRGFSGTNFDRPEFNRMMGDVRDGRINCLILKDLSRFGRDYLETTNYIEVILPFLGVRLISVNDHFDTDDEKNGNKELEVTLKNLANDMYAKDISKKIFSSKRQDMLRGRVIGGSAPYGYRIDREDELRRYRIDEPAAGIVRDMFRMAEEGMSLRDIAADFKRRKVSIPGEYKKTGRLHYEAGDREVPWRASTLVAMLHNEVYIGKLAQGKRRSRLYENEAQSRQPKEEWEVTENAHEPIVTEELFRSVAEILGNKVSKGGFCGENRKDLPKKNNKYKGLAYCGVCGRHLLYKSDVRTSAKQPYRVYHLYCDNRLEHEGNKGMSVVESKVDGIVAAGIRKEAAKLSDKGITVSYCNQVMGERIRELEKKLEKAGNRCARIEGEQFEGYQKYALGEVGREEYLKHRDHCEKRILTCRNEMKEMEDRIAAERKDMEKSMLVIKSLYRTNGKKLLEDGLLHMLVERIEVSPDGNIAIAWEFRDFCDTLDGNGWNGGGFGEESGDLSSAVERR